MTDLTPIKPPQQKPTPPRPAPRKKIRSKAAKSSGSRPMLAVIGGVLLLSVFLFLRNRTAPVSEMPAKIEASDAPKIIESTKELKQMQAQGQQRSALLIAERAAGLRSLPLQNLQGHPPTLRVQVKSFSRGCTLGDLDIITKDQEWLAASKPSLVLSLEELGPSDRKPKQKLITVEQLRQGMNTEFILDGIHDRTMMGLFLCSTRNGEPCQQASRPNLAELSQLQSQINASAKNQNEYPNDNKVFFFHFLVAYPDRLLLHDSGQTLESSQSRLQAALEKGGGNVSPAQLNDVMERIRSAGSLPGIVMTDYLQIQLPHRGDKCL